MRIYPILHLRPQDKAALLAGMEPRRGGTPAGLHGPNEAVLLLSVLGDGTSKLVSNFLTPEDRDRLVEVRRAQEQVQGSCAQGACGVATLTVSAPDAGDSVAA